MSDDRPSIAELRQILRDMTPADQYKADESWNNGGMPLADFAIPAHNGGVTVEMLAVDAFGIVAIRHAVPVLVEIVATALTAESTGRMYRESGWLVGRENPLYGPYEAAIAAHAVALAKVRP